MSEPNKNVLIKLMKRVSYLKNVVSSQRLGGVPTQGHEIGSNRHRKEDDVEDLKQGPLVTG